MKRIDAFTHFYPKGYYDLMGEVAGHMGDMVRRARAIPAIHDLDERFRVMDKFDDYAQVLSLPAPPLEIISGGNPDTALELAKRCNDGLAELCAKHPDRFPAFVAQTPLAIPDAGVAETQRHPGSRRDRYSNLQQCSRQAARPAGIRTFLRSDERTP
jgi:uncharacterized protein